MNQYLLAYVSFKLNTAHVSFKFAIKHQMFFNCHTMIKKIIFLFLIKKQIFSEIQLLVE